MPIPPSSLLSLRLLRVAESEREGEGEGERKRGGPLSALPEGVWGEEEEEGLREGRWTV